MENLNKFIRYLKTERNYSDYTIHNYELDITDYLIFSKENGIDIYNVKYNDVKKYLLSLYNKKYKVSSIDRHISSLRAYYSYLYDNNLVSRNMFKYISLPKKEKLLPKYVNTSDLDIIFNSIELDTPIGIRNRLIFELLYATGMRVSELCNICLSDINISERTIRIIGKGNKERIVIFNHTCSDILSLYLEEARCLLLNGKGSNYLLVGKNKTSHLSVRSIELIIDKVILNAGINKNITPHTIRHTFATHLLNEGCDILVVKELLGHSSLDTTGIYTHVSNERLRGVYLNSHPRAKK